jgi:simple sugar transport system permease protein
MTAELAFIADALVRATPLILTGLAVAIAFRGGVLNIGADGQFLAGAVAAAIVGVTMTPHTKLVALPLALALGACGGGVWALIAAYLRTRFRVLEVISTIMLNFVAAYGVSYLVRGPLQESTHIYPQTEMIAPAAQLPRLMPGTRLHGGIILAILLAIAAWWIIRFTAAGFRLRATGANPFAAQSAGQIDTTRVTTMAFLASGMLAGLAGAIEVCGVTFALYENLSPGYGYTGIAVALLANLNPLWVIPTGLLFGALEGFASALQRNANVPSTVATVIEALLILAVLATSYVRTRRRNRRSGTSTDDTSAVPAPVGSTP